MGDGPVLGECMYLWNDQACYHPECTRRRAEQAKCYAIRGGDN